MHASGAASTTANYEWCEEGGGLLHFCVPRTRAMSLEEVNEVSLVLFADAFQLENFPEVGVGFVGNVDEIGLHERFGW